MNGAFDINLPSKGCNKYAIEISYLTGELYCGAQHDSRNFSSLNETIVSIRRTFTGMSCQSIRSDSCKVTPEELIDRLPLAASIVSTSRLGRRLQYSSASAATALYFIDTQNEGSAGTAGGSWAVLGKC